MAIFPMQQTPPIGLTTTAGGAGAPPVLDPANVSTTWTSNEPVDFGRAADACVRLDVRIVSWLCAPQHEAPLREALDRSSFAAWDGWGGEGARRKAAPWAYLPVEVSRAHDGWGFRYERHTPFLRASRDE